MARRLVRSILFVFLAPLAFALASCGSGDELSPVTGSVRVDGKPAQRAVVMFHPENPTSVHEVSATAVTAEDGTFTLATGAKYGVKPGKYVVTITWPDPKAAPRMLAGNSPDPPDVLGGKYATREKTTLRADVKPGSNSLDSFELTK
jgi:hypothetical protein